MKSDRQSLTEDDVGSGLLDRLKGTMISAYVIPPLVFGMVLSELWLIHHFWLRQAFIPGEDNYQTAGGEKAARGVTMADVAEIRKMEPATSVA